MPWNAVVSNTTQGINFWQFFFFQTGIKEMSEQYAGFLILSKKQQVSSDHVHWCLIFFFLKMSVLSLSMSVWPHITIRELLDGSTLSVMLQSSANIWWHTDCGYNQVAAADTSHMFLCSFWCQSPNNYQSKKCHTNIVGKVKHTFMSISLVVIRCVGKIV